MADRFVSPTHASSRAGGWDALSASVDSLLQRRPLILDFEDSSAAKLHLAECVECGVNAVPIYKVVLSPLRHAAFEQCLPQQAAAFAYPVADRTAPPITFYKVGDSYFVRDGYVRVAQARTRGQLFLRAHVTECHIGDTTCSAGLVRRLLMQDRASFFAQYPFPAGHAAYSLESRTLGNWLHLAQHLEHVGVAQRLLGGETGTLARWYDTWYQPVARIIQRSRVLNALPTHRELDVFLWAVERHGPLASDQSFDERLRLAQRSVIALWAACRQREQ